jgi:hypothetical protein
MTALPTNLAWNSSQGMQQGDNAAPAPQPNLEKLVNLCPQHAG